MEESSKIPNIKCIYFLGLLIKPLRKTWYILYIDVSINTNNDETIS